MLMLDLFAGLGGASRAMQEAGWTVIRVDNNLLDVHNIDSRTATDVLEYLKMKQCMIAENASSTTNGRKQ